MKDIVNKAKSAVKKGLSTPGSLMQDVDEGFFGPPSPQDEHKGLVQDTTTFYWKMLPPKKGKVGGSYDPNVLGPLRTNTGYGPAPRLSPITIPHDDPHYDVSRDKVQPATLINIRDKHHWTESPISSRREVPMLLLKEYKIMTNPMVNQIANNVMTAAQATGEAAAGVTDLIKKLSGDVEQSSGGADQTKALSEAERKAKEQAARKSQAESLTQSLGQAAGEAITQSLEESESGYANPLNPYSFLYTVKPTMFKYTFPYLEDQFKSIANNFGGSDSGGLIGGAMSGAASKLYELTSALSFRKMMAPGIMIEQPKAFSFSGREKSYTVTFPLFNTKNYDEVVRNWQFLFLLTYQNTPNRITKDLVDPPCIYEARIPGLWYSSYSCISNMTVQFQGARREMPMPVKYIEAATGTSFSGTGTEQWLETNRKIKTIVPDAYMVSITVTELFSETQNTLYHMLRETMDSKVTVNGL